MNTVNSTKYNIFYKSNNERFVEVRPEVYIKYNSLLEYQNKVIITTYTVEDNSITLNKNILVSSLEREGFDFEAVIKEFNPELLI